MVTTQISSNEVPSSVIVWSSSAYLDSRLGGKMKQSTSTAALIDFIKVHEDNSTLHLIYILKFTSFSKSQTDTRTLQ